ncbi:MAG: dethiobiotin synthase [Alphaproteobacteria bacterium]
MNGFVIAGTDTDVGKTVFAAALMSALNAFYWKPVQCGTKEGTDTKTVQSLSGLTDEKFLPEKYIFANPLSPHRAAELDRAKVDRGTLKVPAVSPLLIETAGGLMVPMTRSVLQIDVIKDWGLPVILCARTRLGTLNHTFLSVEALKSRGIKIHGIAFIGEENEDNMRTIQDFSGVKILGRLPKLDALNADNLREAFEKNFLIENFVIPTEWERVEGSAL